MALPASDETGMRSSFARASRYQSAEAPRCLSMEACLRMHASIYWRNSSIAARASSGEVAAAMRLRISGWR